MAEDEREREREREREGAALSAHFQYILDPYRQARLGSNTYSKLNSLMILGKNKAIE